MQSSYKNMMPHIKAKYTFRLWSRSVEEDFISQWVNEDRHSDGGWDWAEIARRHREVKDKVVALYVNERLSALSLIKMSSSRVLVRFLEGDPRPDCHIKGSRALLMLDLAATYGQRLGRKEIHLQPLNGDLAELYRSKFGFVDGTDGSGEPVLKRGLS